MVGDHNSVAISPGNVPVISYFDQTLGVLKVAGCADPSCSNGNQSRVTVDSGSVVGRYSSIALDSGGLPVIAYYDATAKALKVVKCETEACR